MARYGFNIGLDGHRIQPLTEKEAEEIADGLTIIYGEARERMLKSVADRVARGVTRYGWAERKANEVLGAHAQLSRDLDRAHAQRESLLSGVIDRAYATGSQQFYADMRSILGDSAHISPNSMKTGYILADLNNSLNAAERRILRQFDDRYADVIGAVSSELATGDMTAKQAVGEALQRFADQGITGFIDRGGHHWTLESYSEMAVLTAIERSTISGYVDTMQSYGYDLAVIDGHIGSCPICEAWEGVIISVSGNDPNYPSLNEAEGAGCFHPRCMHGIHTYYEGITHAPAGGFRDAPREMRRPSAQYTARSKLRYMERMAQKYRDRALVAQTPQQKAQANAKAREWSAAANRQKSLQLSRTSGNISLPDIRITRGVGPRGQNYWVLDFSTGKEYSLVPNTVIKNVTVFAGKGTKTAFRAAEKYADRYGGKPEDWQHAKGNGWLQTEEGDRPAEIHWVQHENAGRYEFFVKRWLDE